MKNPFIKKHVLKNLSAGLFTLCSMMSAANAAVSVESGSLTFNIDKTVLNSIGDGSTPQQSLYIEHFFTATEANVLEGPGDKDNGTGLLYKDLDHVEIENYSNLAFDVQAFGLPGDIIGTKHQLQGTHFLFDDPNSPVGQIGFGGVLRLSTYLAGTTTTSGRGEIGAGDFTLTKIDRSVLAPDASGWVFKTTTGIAASKYKPFFDTKNVAVEFNAANNTLEMSGDLFWAPETLAFFKSRKLITTATAAGSFSLTATTSADAVIPGDVNNSQSVDITDIVSIINLVLGTGKSTPGSDCNQDGSFDILDIVCSINFALAE